LSQAAIGVNLAHEFRVFVGASLQVAGPMFESTLDQASGLRRLFNRARPDWVELNILRGILSAVQRRTRAGGVADPSPDLE
jgi:hypothetical protein